MGDTVSWLTGIVGAVVAWLVCQMLAELVGGAIWEAAGPVRRPIWRLFVAAQWPWPLLLMLAIGAAAMVTGVIVLSDLSRQRLWGMGLLLGGAALVLMAPFLWRDARRERIRRW